MTEVFNYEADIQPLEKKHDMVAIYGPAGKFIFLYKDNTSLADYFLGELGIYDYDKSLLELITPESIKKLLLQANIEAMQSKLRELDNKTID